MDTDHAGNSSKLGGLAGVDSKEQKTTPATREPRLVISKLVLRNFKSYGGCVEIGPFHKSFTSIVGPNGSGKSNVIDALLFVFGFKAKKMRQGKLSDLIHNSATFPNLDSAGVEVHFQEIFDMPGPDAYEVLNDSSLIVSRTVEKSKKGDKSTYRINGRTSTFSEVTDLLKSKGVDLDHKRFLILQGEVESIALMKPKAQTEHEDGLLEYMEDIIGTSKYKEQIESLAKELDVVSEERDEKLNRLKIVEKEKNALEPKKTEAEKFITMENEIISKKNQLTQVDIHDKKLELETNTQEILELSANLERERENFASTSQLVGDLEMKFKATSQEFEKLFKESEHFKKEISRNDKREVELREKEKHLSVKRKKLEKSLKQDTFSKSEFKSWIQNFEKDIKTAEAECKELSARLTVEEKQLETISESLKGKTKVIQDEIERKQTELGPWVEQLNVKRAQMEVSQSELKLLMERAESAEGALNAAKKQLEECRDTRIEKESGIEETQSHISEIQTAISQLDGKLKKYAEKETSLKAQAISAKEKVAEAKMSQQSSQTRGAVLGSLMKQKQQGNIPGICGRLGDLGVIDDKYDVAVTTACGQLDNIVVDTVETAQRCIEFLKVQKLGRATFLCLDKMTPLGNNASQFQAPDQSKRLFDLITAKEERYRPVFYHALRDTLVTKDIAKANVIAYGGSRRQRVVTLEGQLIDSSGTMSGGGSRPQAGGMCSKFVNRVGFTAEEMAALEEEERGWEAQLDEFLKKKSNYEEQRDALLKELPQATLKLSKLQMDLKSAVKQIGDLEKQVQLLSQKSQAPTKEEMQRLSALKSEVARQHAEYDKVEVKKTRLDEDIAGLQDQILQAGGVKLRSQKATVDGIIQQIDGCNEHITSLHVEKTAREKAIAKVESSFGKKEAELAEIDKEEVEVQESLNGFVKGHAEAKAKVNELEHVLEEMEAEKSRLKMELESKSAIINKFKALELQIRGSIAEREQSILQAKKAIKNLQASLADLKYLETGFEEEPLEPLAEYSTEELEMMDPAVLEHEIKQLSDKVSKLSPNLGVLTEYRQKMSVYLGRFKELEDVTAKRDEIRSSHENLRKRRLDEFMDGFYTISYKLKEMYQMITLGGNAELELVDSMDPFSEGIIFSVMPPKKSWKNISNLSGGEKTLSSLALVFALHHYKPTPLYFMDEIDAALDFRNVSIVANYIKERTKNAQFIIISLRNNMFELADRLVGIYKTDNTTKSIAINPNLIVLE
ncbi:hypothetical protein HDU81_003041 [Chytriomyces hyalinus]|nr:hypothetical protein HDU81_003041 [Chytriomyces hyalinus]